MAAPRPPHRRAPVDHVAEVLMHLQACETALQRIEGGRLSTQGREIIAQLAANIQEGRLQCAEAMEILLPGRLQAPDRKPQ